MTHFTGSQEPALLQTATFIVNNSGDFTDGIVRWSSSFINGGISNVTYQELLARVDVSIIPTVGGGNTIIQEQSAADFGELFPLQTQQLIDLGAASVDISEALAGTQAQLQAAIDANREYISEVNQRLSEQALQLGTSITETSQGDGLGGLTTFLGGIGTGGLIAVAVVGFFVLRGKF